MDIRLETKVSELTEVTQFKCGFAHDVKRAIPRVKIGQRTNGTDGAYHYVYMDGHPHVMGYLYYGDMRENPKDVIDHYCVASIFIKNGKYWKHLADFDQKKIDILDGLWNEVIHSD